MKKLVIRLACSLVLLGFSVSGGGPFARANDGGPQGLAPHRSGGTASNRPTGDSTRGEGLYGASCVVCHGTRAAGGIGPRLAGNPVLSNEQVFWTILHDGRHVMPPLQDAVTEQQMADIQAWLKTLP